MEDMKIKEMTTKHIENHINWLKRFLDTKPERQVYSGNGDYGGDWVEQENMANDDLEEQIEDEIKMLEKELTSRITT